VKTLSSDRDNLPRVGSGALSFALLGRWPPDGGRMTPLEGTPFGGRTPALGPVHGSAAARGGAMPTAPPRTTAAVKATDAMRGRGDTVTPFGWQAALGRQRGAVVTIVITGAVEAPAVRMGTHL
jgi:hypothetical protein